MFSGVIHQLIGNIDADGVTSVCSIDADALATFSGISAASASILS